MKNILDVPVSLFENCTSPRNPQEINLWEWLHSDTHRADIERLRTFTEKAKRDRIKRSLPGITPSGLFSYRKKDGLIRHSGLICIDIDAKENPEITDFEELKQRLARMQNIAYCSLSASGRRNGLFCLIPISSPEKHEQHFDALKGVFQKLGIVIDGCCRDVCRLRGCTWDEAPHINMQAKPYSGLYTPPKPRIEPLYHPDDEEAVKRAKQLTEQICRQGIDITGGYETWRNLAFAIADGLGEQGRGIFHAISQFAPSYKPAECDRQYSACLRSRGTGITLATFFKICKEYGLTFKQNL